jgi:hypothetical protein
VAGIARFRRRMDIFGFEQVRMAFRGHAALFRGSRCGCPVNSVQSQEKKDEYYWNKQCFFHRFSYRIPRELLFRHSVCYCPSAGLVVMQKAIFLPLILALSRYETWSYFAG